MVRGQVWTSSPGEWPGWGVVVGAGRNRWRRHRGDRRTAVELPTLKSEVRSKGRRGQRRRRGAVEETDVWRVNG